MPPMKAPSAMLALAADTLMVEAMSTLPEFRPYDQSGRRAAFQADQP